MEIRGPGIPLRSSLKKMYHIFFRFIFITSAKILQYYLIFTNTTISPKLQIKLQIKSNQIKSNQICIKRKIQLIRYEIGFKVSVGGLTFPDRKGFIPKQLAILCY